MFNTPMTKVVITLPEFFPGEAGEIAVMLSNGIADLIHLRKPGSSAEDMERLIRQIPDTLRCRLVLHDHYHLTPLYGLHGIHLNSRNPEPHNARIKRVGEANFQHSTFNLQSSIFTSVRESAIPSQTSLTFNFQCSISRSCHSLAEVAEWKERCSYVSLSPIFDSISKQGYKSAFSREELLQARHDGIIDDKVFALGGITFSRIEEVKALGFGGAMILGDAWKKSPAPTHSKGRG